MPQASKPYKGVEEVVKMELFMGAFLTAVCVTALVTVEDENNLLAIRSFFAIFGAAFYISLICGIFLWRANKSGNIKQIRCCKLGHTICTALLIIGYVVGISTFLTDWYAIGVLLIFPYIILPYNAMAERIQELEAMNSHTSEEETTEQLKPPV